MVVPTENEDVVSYAMHLFAMRAVNAFPKECRNPVGLIVASYATSPIFWCLVQDEEDARIYGVPVAWMWSLEMPQPLWRIAANEYGVARIWMDATLDIVFHFAHLLSQDPLVTLAVYKFEKEI